MGYSKINFISGYIAFVSLIYLHYKMDRRVLYQNIQNAHLQYYIKL
ncbi:hypothetical protein EMUCRT_0825 [Ehrlichia cf. muris str. EmCRT]|uniref:Uncharacterized protein n=1 Tax=Ehrlichia cf. muris str. EmCRT TaxID=1359167 RepID=A0A0F3N6L6_9RICK|nr:hypothetical protein EMUCRT_0825 [Ehrlichia cf. muris str. EmCRT]